VALIDVTKTGDLPQLEAVIAASLPESLLRIGKTYLTGVAYSKTITYKGKTYTPGPLNLITVRSGDLMTSPAPARYTFTVGNKTYRINEDRNQITIIAGGEPIIWRLIRGIQAFDPAETDRDFLAEDQGIITTGVALTPFSYFYSANGIYQSEPLQDGVIFRLLDRASGAITWRKFTASIGGGGFFEEFAAVPNAAIATIKNVDLNNLQDFDQILAAFDTIDGKPFDPIFGLNGEERIEQSVLVNGQTNQIENGLYYFSCTRGKPEKSSAERLSPYLKNFIAYIGRSRCLVWRGDRFGQSELWIKSDTPIQPNGSAPRVSIGNGKHFWDLAKPILSLEKQIALMDAEKGVVEEEDEKALDAIKAAKSEITEAISALATSDEVAASLTELDTAINALDLSKADKTTTDALNQSLLDLKKLVDAGASDEELAAEIKKVNDAIAAAKANENVFYTSDTAISVQAGDDIIIVLGGNIHLPANPQDGDEVKVFDPRGLIKAGANNILPGSLDTIGNGQGAIIPDSSSALSWATDDPLAGGFALFKYRSSKKNWNVFFSVGVLPEQQESSTPADQDYQPGSLSTAPLAHSAIAAIVDKMVADIKKQRTVESSNPPDLDDPNWAIWIQRTYDYSVPSGVAKAWLRTPDSSDGLPFANTWSEAITLPTVADATPDPSRTDLRAIELPQGARFRFPATFPLNSPLSCEISWTAGVFTGISYQLVDANRVVIPRTPRAQMISATDAGAGIGWASVPSNAKFAQFTFSYRNGGNLAFEFPIT
jgi:hypothetical protein